MSQEVINDDGLRADSINSGNVAFFCASLIKITYTTEKMTNCRTELSDRRDDNYNNNFQSQV